MIIEKIQKELRKHASSEKAKILSRFFKTGKGKYGEGDKFLGVVVPDVRKIVKKYHKQVSTDDLNKFVKNQFHEERLTALLIAVLKFQKGNERDKKEIYDFYLLNTNCINNWDLIDLTAPNIIGPYLQDKDKSILVKLAKSKSIWERRISILSTFYFIKQGDPSFALKIAEILVQDKHDLIQKAVGWMLREVGKRCGEEVEEEFLEKHYKTMPRTMLRYAIEKLPEKKRKYFLQK